MGNIEEMIASWVKEARKGAGLSQEALGTKLALEMGEQRGFTKANISHWETKKHSPNLKQLMAIAKITERSLPPELLAAVGGALPKETAVVGTGGIGGDYMGILGAMPVRVGVEKNTIPIRRMNLSFRGGLDRVEIEPDLTDGGVFPMPQDVIERCMLKPDELIAVKVRGQSMEPMMFEDDLIVIDLGDKRATNKELYAIRFDGDLCVKQLLNRGGQWYLHSLNPDFQDVNARSGEFDIIGRVVYQPGRIVTGRL